MNTEHKVAFALAGLAGNNSYGAGFLQAALDVGIKPNIISCTSGQIYYVRLYLEALQSGDSSFLEQEITKQTDPLERYQKSTELLLGMNPFMRPVYPAEVMQDITETILLAEQKSLKQASQWSYVNLFTSYRRQLMNMIPGRTLVPQFSEDFLEETAKLFNSDDVNKQRKIGIAFNSYDPQNGHETVYLNEVAKEQLEVKFEDPKQAAESNEEGSDRPDTSERQYRFRTHYEAITARSVMDALWVYQYGFDKSIHPLYKKTNQDARFDGAFWRQVLLSELVGADKIYVVRPISHGWVGGLPYSSMEIEDLKLETMFNSAYMGERDKIHLINKLICKKENTLPGYHSIDLVEIEVRTQESYLEYLSENKSLFDQARQQALVEFAKR